MAETVEFVVDVADEALSDRYIRTRDQFVVDTSPDFIERVKAQGRM